MLSNICRYIFGAKIQKVEFRIWNTICFETKLPQFCHINGVCSHIAILTFSFPRHSFGLEKLGYIDQKGHYHYRYGIKRHPLGYGMCVHQIPMEKGVANSNVAF